MTLNALEFNFLFTLTIILLIFKGGFILYIGKKVYDKYRERASFKIDLLFSILIIMICLFISRILYTYFDFFLTEFDSSKYYLMPNIIIWKIASVLNLLGLAFVIFIIDKQALKFKFKGFFSYFIIVLVIIEMIYFVNSAEGFEFISTLGLIAVIVGGLIFPIIFIYIGLKTPLIRRTALLFAFGIIIMIIGHSIVGEFIIAPLRISYGSGIVILFWIISITLKIIGLLLIFYSSTKLY